MTGFCDLLRENLLPYICCQQGAQFYCFPNDMFCKARFLLLDTGFMKLNVVTQVHAVSATADFSRL